MLWEERSIRKQSAEKHGTRSAYSASAVRSRAIA
jgi:hypothetical protein